MVKLQVFISNDCWSCDEARRIAASVATQFPEVTVELLNIEEIESPPDVFAIPTYKVNGQVIFLGNPTPQALSQKLAVSLKRSVA